MNSSSLETARCDGFVDLFNTESKADLEKYCRGFVVRQVDLVMWILTAQRGGLEEYRYASHFADKIPTHLHPTDEERAAIGQNGLGPLRGRASKAFSKIAQLFIERRHFCAHLFYTMNGNYWFLFYFDQRDLAERGNHWKHGPHIHLISHHWPNRPLDDVWGKVLRGETNFANKIHLRYDHDKDGRGGAGVFPPRPLDPSRDLTFTDR